MTLSGWSVQSWRGNCRIVAQWQLRSGEEPLTSTVFRSEIEEWSRYLPDLLTQLYEAAYGYSAPEMQTDRDTILEEQIEEAFRQRLLLLVPEEPRERSRQDEGSGGGGAAGAPAPPPPPPPQQNQNAGDETGSDSGDTPPPPPKQVQKTWFRASLKDEEGEPMAGEDYILVDTDGVKREGKLDANGEVYIPPILPPGQCTISFPKIHLNPRKKKK